MQLKNTPVPPCLRTEVLAVSGSADDLNRLREIFDGSLWQLRTARTVDEAAQWLSGNQMHAVLCAGQLPDGDWKTVLRLADGMAHPANVIVFSRHADDRLWAEVVNFGGFDVLDFPSDAAEVLRVVSNAWLYKWDRGPDRLRA